MHLWPRVGRLIMGLFCYAIGIMLTIKAEIGYSPWDVFHAGIANTVDVPFGVTTIGVGAIIVVLATILGETVGIGTLLNMLLIGVFLDLIIWSGVIPTATNLWTGIAMLTAGMVVIAIATFFYISSGFGAGPRDSLMVALHRKTNLPVGLCRGIIEVLVTILGFLMGGLVGIGTIVTATLIGPFIQIVFHIVRFDPRTLHHESLADTYRCLRGQSVTPA